MAGSFFFYDLETSGISARSARIMQFAGQRTDMDLKPVGEPANLLIKLTPDIVPEPDAILITGITPQESLADGLTEAEFLKYFYEEVVAPDTIFVGYNSVRFDDEFMRYLNYRNFYDAYGWQWQNGCSRWDLLDVVRMTRALRPDGIEWPFAPDGKQSNRLEYLTKVNKLDHAHAHDALNDVLATIAVAELIKSKQPDLFNYLLKNRSKQAVKQVVQTGNPFVYTSGRYPSQFTHTTAAIELAKHSEQDASLVYNLRVDPTPFIDMTVDEIIKAWEFTRDPDALRLPVKTLKFNRCPAVAPLGVIKDEATQTRIDLTIDQINQNLKKLKSNQVEFTKKIAEAVVKMDKQREKSQLSIVDNEQTVDERLYDGFIAKSDSNLMAVTRAAEPSQLSDLAGKFSDDRLRSLLPLYKARNYPKALDSEERAAWEGFIAKKLLNGGQSSLIAKYFNRLQDLSKTKLSDEKQYLLEELKLYGESIMPADVAD